MLFECVFTDPGPGMHRSADGAEMLTIAGEIGLFLCTDT